MASTNKGSAKVAAKTQAPVKIPNKVMSSPPQGSLDPNQDIKRDANASRLRIISDIRQESDVVVALRRLATDERYLSGASFSLVHLAMSPFTARGYDNVTGEFSQDITATARQIMVSMDTLTDYSLKFNKKPTIRQFVETALREVNLTGALAAELVMSKEGLPDRLQAVPYESISFKSKKDGGVYPVQKPAKGEKIELDIANFFISELNLGANETYTTPMYKSALIDTFQNSDFIDDMRRAVNKSGHSRLVVTLNAEKVKASASDETQSDPTALMDYMKLMQDKVTSDIAGLKPDDSVVVYDNVAVEVADIGGNKSDYVPLMQTLSNMQATSLKAPPSMLGIRSTGSQSLSNSETLTYLKMAKAIQGPVVDVMSRALTLAVRLLGAPGYIKFEFEPIEMRPDGELEAYRQIKQKRILEQLSLGMISDQESCLMLGLVYSPTMQKLSGTNFYGKQAIDKTSVSTDSVDNTGGMESNMSPDTPDKSGGESQ
jgi:hypothetical protein